MSTCQHEFIEDLIDITPERSQTIWYCKYCEMTKCDEPNSPTLRVGSVPDSPPIRSRELVQNSAPLRSVPETTSPKKVELAVTNDPPLDPDAVVRRTKALGDDAGNVVEASTVSKQK